MHSRSYIIVIVLLAIGLVAPGAFARTPVPPDSGGACAPATPCSDSVTRAGLKLGSLAVETVAPAAGAAAQTANTGLGLAWAVMALLLLALLYAIAAAVFATVGREFPMPPEGSHVLIPVLSVLGLGAALYLTYVETTNVAAVCGPIGDCNAVQASPYAKLFGFLPVGLLGAIGYVGILVAWFVARSTGAYGRIAALLLFAMALFGVLFSIYLTYLELLVIHAACIWCLGSAVLMSLILFLSIRPALGALETDGPEVDEE